MGGLGGGGLLIPYLMIFFGIPLLECVPLGNLMGLLAALTRFIVNYKQKHPSRPQRLSINYEVIQLTMPMLYLGTLLGVHLHLSEAFVAVTLEALLVIVSFKTIQKAVSLRKDENRERAV